MRLSFAMLMFRRSAASARKRAPQEPADMGTAFGLDASLADGNVLPDLAVMAKVAEAAVPVSSRPWRWLARRSRR